MVTSYLKIIVYNIDITLIKVYFNACFRLIECGKTSLLNALGRAGKVLSFKIHLFTS